MSEPYKNYVQYFISTWEHLVSIANILREANILVTFSKDKQKVGYQYSYLILNTKNRSGVWNNIQLHMKCTVIDNAFMDQLKVLESVSLDAQLEFLFNPL